MIDNDDIDDTAEVDCKQLVLLAHPIHTTQVHSFDTEINANLSSHVKKAVVDYLSLIHI